MPSSTNSSSSSPPEFSFTNLVKFKPAEYQQAIHLPAPNEGHYFGDSIQAFTTTANNNRMPQGKGVSISIDGQTRFGGQWNRGKRHGRGTFTSPTLDYDGEWWDDAMHGNCHQMKYKSSGGLWGAIKSLRSQPKEYCGEIHRDHGVHGRGKMLYTNGEIYEGEWYQGKKNGRGVQTTDEGERYDGQFENDTRHGTGVLALSSGSQYLGMFSNGRRHGHGKMLRQNGDIYVGEFNQDEMQGNGVMTYKNGDTYSGEWRYNTRHGRGIFKLAEKGALVSGTFVSGLLQGDGTVEIPGKSIFIGEFLHGERVFGTMWLDGPKSTAKNDESNKNNNNKSSASTAPKHRHHHQHRTNNNSNDTLDFNHHHDHVDVPPTPLPPLSPATIDKNNNANDNHNKNEAFSSKNSRNNNNNNNNNSVVSGLTSRHTNPGAGGVYHGPFKGDGVHGKGLFWYPDGSFYCGDWFNGKRQGMGFMKHADGTEYSGEFFDDERHGRGLLKLPTSNNNNNTSSLSYPLIACGIFDTDSSITVGYYGEWNPVKNELCGRGTFIEENGAVYEGLVQQSRREILGSITVPVVMERVKNVNNSNNNNDTSASSQQQNSKKNGNRNDHDDPAFSKSNEENTANKDHLAFRNKMMKSNNNSSTNKVEFSNWPNMVTAIFSKYGAARSRALKNFFAEIEEGNSGDYADLLLKRGHEEEAEEENNKNKNNKRRNRRLTKKSKTKNDNNDDDDVSSDDEDNEDENDDDFSPERKYHHLADFGPNGRKSTVAVHTVHLRIRGAASSASCRVHSHSQLEPPSRRNLDATTKTTTTARATTDKDNNKDGNNGNHSGDHQEDDDDASGDDLNQTSGLHHHQERNNNNNTHSKQHTRDVSKSSNKKVSYYIGGTFLNDQFASNNNNINGTDADKKKNEDNNNHPATATATTTTASSSMFKLIYRGGFVADAAHGEGTLVLENSIGQQIACYTGMFAGGEPCGNGVVTGAMCSDRFFSGDWLRGRPTGLGVLYDRGTDITSPLPELPVQSSNAIMRLFTMRAHSRAEAEAARLARIRRGIHRLPHVVRSDWYGGENHGDTTVFFRSSASNLFNNNTATTSLSASSSSFLTTKIATFSLLHGSARLVFPHALQSVTSPAANSKSDDKCLLCGLAYGLLRVPVRCRCCARVGCTSCCETAQLAPHVPTIVLDEFTEHGQTHKVRHDDRMAALKQMTLSHAHHSFDNFFGTASGGSGGDGSDYYYRNTTSNINNAGGRGDGYFFSSSSSSLSSAAAAALYNRSHLATSSSIAKEKLTISARICEMCSFAIEEQLTKVSLFEEEDEEEILGLKGARLNTHHRRVQHNNNSSGDAAAPEGTNKDYSGFDAADYDSSDDEIVTSNNDHDDADGAEAFPFHLDDDDDSHNNNNAENERFYRKLTKTSSILLKQKRSNDSVVNNNNDENDDATMKNRRPVIKGYISGHADKEGKWTDVCSVWNRILMNLCQNPRTMAYLKNNTNNTSSINMSTTTTTQSQQRRASDDENPTAPLPIIDLQSNHIHSSKSDQIGSLTDSLLLRRRGDQQQQHHQNQKEENRNHQPHSGSSSLSSFSSSYLMTLIASLSNSITNEISASRSNVQYHGSMHSNQRSGFGTMIMNYLDGEGYRGHWKRDLRDGEGIYRFPVHACEEQEVVQNNQQKNKSSSSSSSVHYHGRNNTDNEEKITEHHHQHSSSAHNNKNTANEILPNTIPVLISSSHHQRSNSSNDDDGNTNNSNPADNATTTARSSPSRNGTSSRNVTSSATLHQMEADKYKVTSFIGISGDWKEGKLIRLRYRGQINAQTWKAEGRGIGFLYEGSNNALVEVYNGDWRNGEPEGVGLVTVVASNTTSSNNNESNTDDASDKKNSENDSTSNNSNNTTTTYVHNYQQEHQFIGFFKNGKRHGPGKSISPSTATITQGLWRNGHQEGRAHIESPTSAMFGVMHNGILEGPVWEQFLIPLEVSASDLQENFERQMKATATAGSLVDKDKSDRNIADEKNKTSTRACVVDAGEVIVRDEKTSNNGNSAASSSSSSSPKARLVRRLLMFTNGEVNTECVTQADALGPWTVSTTTSCSFCGESFGLLSHLWTTKYYCRCCARVGCGKCVSKYRALPEHLCSIAATKEESAHEYEEKQKEHHRNNNNTQQQDSQKQQTHHQSLICTLCDSFIDSGVTFGSLIFEDGLVYCGHIETKNSDCTLPHPNGFGLWYRRDAANDNNNNLSNGSITPPVDVVEEKDSSAPPLSSSSSSTYVSGNPFSWNQKTTKREYNYSEFKNWWKKMLDSFNIDQSLAPPPPTPSTTTKKSSNDDDDESQTTTSSNNNKNHTTNNTNAAVINNYENAMNYDRNTEQHDSLTSVFYHSDAVLETVLQTAVKNDVPASVKIKTLAIPNPKDIGVNLHQQSSVFSTRKNDEAMKKLKEIYKLKLEIQQESRALRLEAKRRRLKLLADKSDRKMDQRQANSTNGNDDNTNQNNTDDPPHDVAVAGSSGGSNGELDSFFQKEAEMKMRVDRRILLDEFLERFLLSTASTSASASKNNLNNQNDHSYQYHHHHHHRTISLFELPSAPAHPEPRPRDPSPLTRAEVDVALKNARAHALDQQRHIIDTSGDRHQQLTNVVNQFKFFSLGPSPPPAPPLRAPFTSEWTNWNTRSLPKNCLPRHLMPSSSSSSNNANKKSSSSSSSKTNNNNNNNGSETGDGSNQNDDFDENTDVDNNYNSSNDDMMFVDPHSSLHNPFLLPGSEGCLTSANATIVDSPNFSPPPVQLLETIRVPILVSSTTRSRNVNPSSVQEAKSGVDNVKSTNNGKKVVTDFGSNEKNSADNNNNNNINDNSSKKAATTTMRRMMPSSIFGLRITIDHSRDGIGAPTLLQVEDDGIVGLDLEGCYDDLAKILL